MRTWSHAAILACLSIKWLTLVVAETIYCDDPELCAVNKRFLRFGRAFDSDADDPYFRYRKQFYRIGRAFQPYQDKRFLRFGRSEQPDVDDYIRAVLLQQQQSEEPLYRKRRSAETGELSQRLARSADKSAPADKDIDKREAETEESEAEKRFMRFGKRFMRFGRELGYDNKRFMRFGKRFMRFGRDPHEETENDIYDGEGEDVDSDDELAKRFMRFGKRFMRFGKREEEDKRFMRFGKSDQDKRFMRFGKSDAGAEEEKRFMRFGKREARSVNLENSNSGSDMPTNKS
ncbi:hypothetical protein Btru_076070 [Bulinus truncatus]|nr:hypothetical protein Btru_076070 [Bulinus truncatus]